MTIQFSSQTKAALSATPLQVWQTITLGTYKGVDAYRDVMDSAGIKIRDSANEILARPAFPYARVKEVELVLLSASELGVETESSLSDVYKRAKQVGLELCPAEVGPQLRLHYRNQPLGEALVYIAMEPIAAYGGDPTILALVNFGSGLELMGVNRQPESMVLRSSRFVFVLPKGAVCRDWGRIFPAGKQMPAEHFTDYSFVY